jgi:uncharacterized protein (TIGR00255 family)
MESMTGFGTHTMTSQGFTITVEARSWNHKALSTSLSLPDLLAGTEEEVVTAVKERFLRGSVRVSVSVQAPQDSTGSFSVDMGVLRTYLKAALSLVGEPGVENRVSAGELLALPGVAVAATVPGPDREALASIFSSCLGISLDNLRSSRLEEGEALSAVFIDAFSTLRTLVEPVLDDLRMNVTRRFDRLRTRVTELLGDAVLDQTRMLQELAFLADRVDVSEEVQRLLCHLDHAGRTLSGDAPDAGRTLGFILQEMHREVNTIGAKSDDPDLSEKVVRMKNILASLKEQAANVQ